MRILGLLLAFGLSATAHALDDAETVRILTALGEWQAAYPLAIAEARRLDTVGAWEAIFSQPEYDDLTRPLNRREVYAEAWAAAKRADSPSAYREFIALAPESDGAALAIDRLFEQVKQEDTLEAYTEFMVEFPATSQSLEAMLRVQELVWQRVREEDTLAAYDGYLDAFPNARFAPEAEAAAQRLVAQPYRERLAQCRADAETLRQQHQSQLRAVLDEQLAEQRAHTQALLEGLEAQTERLEAAIEQHQAVLQQQLVQVSGQMAQSGELSYTEKLRRGDEIRRWVGRGLDGVCLIGAFVPSTGRALRSVCSGGSVIRTLF
jgi:hypothetical protein